MPQNYEQYLAQWNQNARNHIANYVQHKTSYLAECPPPAVFGMPQEQVIYILSQKFGEQAFRNCFNPDFTQPSPVQAQPNSNWLKSTAMVGVNVRTIGSFWNVVKYALTLPNRWSAIHLLPIWECGVVASLYGKASWHINTEFFDNSLVPFFPNLNTAEKQLKVVVNLLHLMGKTVGIDVVPHTDRYSEIVLANPDYFEWLQRKDYTIIDHTDQVVQKVKQIIIDFISQERSASGDYFSRNATDFFDNDITEEQVRIGILFGDKNNKEGRLARRKALINSLYEQGLEPCPATMGPPYRGLIVDQNPTAKTVDDDHKTWLDYTFEKPTEMSRAFGPLTRYKLYESKNNNKNWEINFEKPRPKVFEYVAQKCEQVADYYHFDFMRGDMSHVQMHPNPEQWDEPTYYDIHQFVKQHIAQQKPYWGYFAESFLEKDNYMAYGSEAVHLNRSKADSALGNLQSFAVQEPQFANDFEKYLQLAQKHNFKPNFTIFSADKDDPRFDSFYEQANELRYFIATFFTFLPSYSSLGFELRDIHLNPAPNEHYTKLYVFQEKKGPKATNGPYVWGQNVALFQNLQLINQFSEVFFAENWQFISFDFNKNTKILSWIFEKEGQKKFFYANFSNEEKKINSIIRTVLFSDINTNNAKLGAFGYGIFEV